MYTPLEIDQMRMLIRMKYVPRNGPPNCFYHVPKDDQIERELLTHMANGTTVAELKDHVYGPTQPPADQGGE